LVVRHILLLLGLVVRLRHLRVRAAQEEQVALVLQLQLVQQEVPGVLQASLLAATLPQDLVERAE
jgi:hypothetical protein